MIGYYFGWPGGQIWPNLLASALCTGLVWWRLHRRSAVHHAEQVALIVRLHFERLEDADRHADEIKRQLTAHCADLKSHITATGSHVITSAVPVPQKLLDELRKTAKKPPGGQM
jgi:hypothetical protein